MKPILMAAVLAALAAPALAEPSYSPDFYDQLSSLGLQREGFLYALRWAGDADPEAELTVAHALLDGIGVAANPMAAISFACRSLNMDDFELQKILIKANLRLIGELEGQVRCAPGG
jgi:hypothetical protein